MINRLAYNTVLGGRTTCSVAREVPAALIRVPCTNVDVCRRLLSAGIRNIYAVSSWLIIQTGSHGLASRWFAFVLLSV